MSEELGIRFMVYQSYVRGYICVWLIQSMADRLRPLPKDLYTLSPGNDPVTPCYMMRSLTSQPSRRF